MKLKTLVLAGILAWGCASKPTHDTSADSIDVIIDTAVVNETQDGDQLIPQDQVYGEIQIIQCVFKSVSESAGCVHIEFSCGDFGPANISNLPADDLLLWNKLVMNDEAGGLMANPSYTGQKFTIVHNLIRKTICEEGSLVKEVPNLVAFRMN